MKSAIDMGAKGHAAFRYRSKLAQRHDLIAARIGQDRAIPAHEAMQAAQSRDALGSRAEHEMIGVAEYDIRTRGYDVVDEYGFDRRGSTDRHEGGCADDAARSCDFSEPGVPVSGQKPEGEGRGHSRVLSA